MAKVLTLGIAVLKVLECRNKLLKLFKVARKIAKN